MGKTVSEKLPDFEYFVDPIENGCITEKIAVCPCCQKQRSHMYVGPIYTVEEIDEVCPWCIADGGAAKKWDASFNDVYNAPDTVPPHVIDTISTRTPGYVTWQGNRWIFHEDRALVFVGEVAGAELLDEGNERKIFACRTALAEWSDDFDLSDVTIAGQPAVYLFRDRKTGGFIAYADMT